MLMLVLFLLVDNVNVPAESILISPAVEEDVVNENLPANKSI